MADRQLTRENRYKWKIPTFGPESSRLKDILAGGHGNFLLHVQNGVYSYIDTPVYY